MTNRPSLNRRLTGALFALALAGGPGCLEVAPWNPPLDGGAPHTPTGSGGGSARPDGEDPAGGGGGSAHTGGGGGTNTGGGANTGGSAHAGGGGSNIGGGANTGGGVTNTGGGGDLPACQEATYTNPVIWEDLADAEVIRVDDTYYYTASTMHFSPGAPILRSKDLVHWEYVGHSVPVLDYGPRFDLTSGHAYVGGIWASTLQYRASDKTFYWMGCMQGGGGGYVYTAKAVEGPWTKRSSKGCYYDIGLLIDDDDTMYVAYGNTKLSVAQLSKDGLSQVKSQQVLDSQSAIGAALEGSRFYKIDGAYYILTTQYAAGEYVLRSTSGPFGPYTVQKFAVGLRSPVTPEPGGSPHQGGLVKTQKGDWYYMAFIDAYPGGRVPVLAPVKWSNGWPSVELVSGGWGASYPFPNLPCTPTKPLTGTDTFSGVALGPEWEWNHNPDNTKWTSGSGLTLETATVTSDLYKARNTLSHRILGPKSTATIELDLSSMQDGDVAGLALLRQSSAWVGVKRAGTSNEVVMVNGLTMDGSWNTTSTGSEAASQPLSGTKVWLRISADITPGANREGKFYFSTDGAQFTQLGPSFIMNRTWNFFMGYRYGIFNYATKSLGGSVKVASFKLETP